MLKKTLILLAALALAAATDASALDQGGNLLSLGFYSGTADFAGPRMTDEYAPAYEHSEIGLQAQYWRMMGADYAFTLSAGYGFFDETDKPAGAGPDQKYSQSSWNLRVGGDRIVPLGDRAHLYFGPGIQYWSGQATFNDFPWSGPETKTPTTTRWSLSLRLGGIMWIGPSWGLNAYLGENIGYASADDSGAETTWWPSGPEGGLGVTFKFGG